MVLEPDEDQINLVCQICSTWIVAMVLEPDGDRTYPTCPGCHGSGTRCNCPTK
jgi:hypothetical protein